MIAFADINWGAPNNVLFFPLIFVIMGFLLYRLRRVHVVVGALSAPSMRSRVLHNYSGSRQWLKFFIFTCGFTFLLLALLRPQWDKKDQQIAQEGRDLFIALDISRSMLAADCKPNRLACAKAKIKALVQKLACERVGLILFSGSTFVQCPLTTDYATFYTFLEHVDVETISSGTTALDQAIKRSLTAFKALPDRKNKLLVVVTDGEDFSSNLAGVKQEAQEANLHIFTLGIGTPEGAPIPLFNDKGKPAGHQLDKKGTVVISRLNEGILSTLAHDSGGTYIRMSKDDQDVTSVIKSVTAFDKEKLEDKKISAYQEQYPYFLAVSFICFALEWLL